MSREINLDEPLSEEDVHYLEQRGQNDLIARARLASEEGDGANASSHTEGLVLPPYLDNAEFLTNVTNTGDVDTEIVKNLNGASESVVPDRGSEYANMTNEELSDELESRSLVKGGNKSEKVMRLLENDRGDSTDSDSE